MFLIVRSFLVSFSLMFSHPTIYEVEETSCCVFYFNSDTEIYIYIYIYVYFRFTREIH